MLRRELLSETIGIEALLQMLGLKISLLSLVLSLLVWILEVPSAVTIALLLCAPDFLLSSLVGVDGLRERGRRGWELAAAV